MLAELGLDPARPLAVVRTPPAVSLYHRFENPLFGAGARAPARAAQVVVLPRTAEQRAELAARAASSCPSGRSTRQSLVAYADLVISAGGTMNREAVALGTPVWTTFEGRLGAVDERADRRGPPAPPERAEDVELAQRERAGAADARPPRPGGVHRPAAARLLVGLTAHGYGA